MRFTLLFLLSSCSLFFGSPEKPKSAKGREYENHFSSKDWSPKKDQRTDYVFEHSSDGRILLSNSFCDEFQDQPLDELAHLTFKSVGSFSKGEGKFTTFHDREAYRLEGPGKVDGVEVDLKILNTRRNNCYFDFVAISPKKNVSNSTASQGFDTFLGAVKFK